MVRLVFAVLLGLSGSLMGLVALWFGFFGDGQFQDATPADIVAGGVNEGEGVWLRGMRDPAAPRTLDDGQVLFPSVDEETVWVDCERGCEGTLTGRLDFERLEGQRIYVVRVNQVSDGSLVVSRGSGCASSVFLLAAVGLALSGLRRRKLDR